MLCIDGTEAPAEMLFYFPQFKAIDLAEDANHTLHNILTLCGAKVRGVQKWAHTLGETINLWGKDAVVSFGSQHWPRERRGPSGKAARPL